MMSHSRIRRALFLPFAAAIVAAALGALPAQAQTPQPPATRAPAAATATPVAPVARIVTPVRGQTLGESVTVQGAATLPGFARYEIAYAIEPDLKAWQVIGGGTQPVENGLLSTWSTRALPPGEYALRLQVYGVDGKSLDTQVRNLRIEPPSTAAPGGTAAAPTVSAPRPTAAPTAAALDTAAIGRSFTRGVEVVALAFAAFGAYLALKRLFFFALGRLRSNRIDYGD